MAATQLSLYNGALRICEERKLNALTDDLERRRYLDDVWADGAIKACLEMGLFSFAMRTVRLEDDPDITVDFGLRYAFALPSDFVQINELSSDEDFTTPVNTFRIEGGYLYADIDTLFMSYVSDDSAYGGNMTLWPESFKALVHAYLANGIVGRLTADKDLRAMVADTLDKNRNFALGRDALKKPARTTPRGNWVGARLGGSGRTTDPQRREW